MRKTGSKLKKDRVKVILICLALLTTTCAIVFAANVIRYYVDLSVSQRELASLPQFTIRTTSGAPTIVWESLDFYESRMREINPDYIGLIMIDGHATNYPVVRGSDNSKYLNTSYSGAENRFGAIFMDYRCKGNDIPHIIIYGHNASDMSGGGYMFNDLFQFLDDQYRAEHPAIRIIKDGLLSEFEIFAVRITDTDDPAYQLDFSAPGSFEAFLEKNGAPPDAPQILTLSTCYLRGGDDGRMIIQGFRKRVYPVYRQMMLAEYVRQPRSNL